MRISRPASMMRVPAWTTGAMDWLWGYDFFVSYGHSDSTVNPNGACRNHFARSLANALRARGFSVFLDETEYDAGVDLRPAMVRRVRSSGKLILLARPRA